MKKITYALFIGLILLSVTLNIEIATAEPPLKLCIFIICEDESEFIFCGPPQALNGVLNNSCKEKS